MHARLAGWLADMDLNKIDASGAERSICLVTHRRLTHGSKALVKSRQSQSGKQSLLPCLDVLGILA